MESHLEDRSGGGTALDPTTGLAHLSHLVELIQEMQAEARVRLAHHPASAEAPEAGSGKSDEAEAEADDDAPFPDNPLADNPLADKVLLLVSIAASGNRQATLFLRARTASVLRALFGEAGTVVDLRPGLFSVLTTDGPGFAHDRSFLASTLEDLHVRARVWTERVPADPPATAQLLSSILVAGDWDGDDS